ncbi:PREDICTED: uncharacterized protein LOC104702565 [Camelina sativa]|uniref:Uncharacterized protein LOC104702565 n=1 Tax=Camelina sativa TaxID=90675 RepID=A0ABM0SVI3_CAMSA|nr:PREDICTED: uncharacterized protein LOC104702565 [Camelina sativa]
MKSRLGNLRLYKFDVPSESDVGVMIISFGGVHLCERFQLTRCTGRGRGRGSKAGLSKSFVDSLHWSFMAQHRSNITNQIFDYIVSNFSFKDLDVVPPACPVLVFHFQIIGLSQYQVNENDITTLVLSTLRTRDSVLSVEDAIARLVPIVAPTTEIVDCYQSPELCPLCEKGYPKEDEIVHKTKCSHIFHATCISRYLLHTPRCPACSLELPPVDMRTLLFL